jgi:hypothetical protein
VDSRSAASRCSLRTARIRAAYAARLLSRR